MTAGQCVQRLLGGLEVVAEAIALEPNCPAGFAGDDSERAVSVLPSIFDHCGLRGAAGLALRSMPDDRIFHNVTFSPRSGGRAAC